jgi:hypothetical protein
MSTRIEHARALAQRRSEGGELYDRQQSTRRCTFCDALIPRSNAYHGCAAESEHRRAQGIEITERREQP